MMSENSPLGFSKKKFEERKIIGTTTTTTTKIKALI